jgi:mono/diheme cytochrome c family protein
MTTRCVSAAILVASAVAGCSRPPDATFGSSAQVDKLTPEQKAQIQRVLGEQCGTPQSPRLLGSPAVSRAHLRQGAALYSRHCVPCHGVTGDGDGVVASYMVPRPRDYRRGIFKFTSTTYGSKPLREDLIRTVRRGIRGTSMPSFGLLAPGDLEALVDYVLVLTHRGELEGEMAEEALVSDSIEPQRVKEMIATVLDRWALARAKVVYPTTPMPEFTPAVLEQGKKAFLTLTCHQCHGEDGRGQMPTNIGMDAWGNPTKAADLTSGMLRGGTEPLDLFRHIDAGINGTPMPSHHDMLQKEPERIWHLVGYVLQIADSRRDGHVPDSGLLDENGLLKPLPGVKARAPVTAALAPATDPGPAGERPKPPPSWRETL